MFGNHKRRAPKPIMVLFFLGMGALFLFVLGNVIMFLWNEILAEATGVKTLNFWEALGLFALTRILFGGFRFGGHRKYRRHKKAQWKKKWMNMSNDERDAFKAKWKERCQQDNNDN